MDTHFRLLKPPPLPQTTRASPWMMLKINSSQPIKHPTSPRRRASSLQAQGRGFGVTVSDKKDSALNSNSNSSNKDGNDDDDDDEIPQVVFDRMLRRVVVSVGAPMGSGIGLLYVLNQLKEQQVWQVPGWLPLLTLLIAFGTSALGIAYGTLSSSWDPDKEGSLLGWEQAVKNWPELWKEEAAEKNR